MNMLINDKVAAWKYKNILPIAAVTIPVVIGFFVWVQLFRWKPSASKGTVQVTIASGASAREVAKDLKQNGVIANMLLFIMYTRVTGTADDIKPGMYVLGRPMDVSSIVRVITDAQTQEHTITLLEGWTIRDMAAYLVKEGVIANEQEWYDVVGTPPGPGKKLVAASSTVRMQVTELAGVIGADAPLEGFLFPDTYRIRANASAEDVALLLMQTYLKKAPRPADAGSEYGRVVLASILEREVRSDADRRKVADLFQRRLKVGMALQADSTVNYITGKKTASITLDDRDIDSLWNTYMYPGLPPTPISNPSVSALNAVLNPEPNDAWYFLTDEEGNVHYATTHDEHVANKNRYLK